MPRTLVFLLTEDWFFASHFWVRALAAKRAGWRVILVARESEATARIRQSGIEVIPVAFIRRRLNPFAEAGFTLNLARLYREIKPDLVHHIALKPIVLGGIAAKLAGVRAIVNAPVGLGFVFSSDKLLARVLRPLVALGLRLTLTPRHSIAVFENPDDMEALVKGGMARAEAITLIRGAGVDIEKFHPTPEPPGLVRIVLIARMIREKGVPEFVEAARQGGIHPGRGPR
jgi:glycosyltransferase involved in cell wall biosynthesis